MSKRTFLEGKPPVRMTGLLGLLDGIQAAREAESIRYKLLDLDVLLEHVTNAAVCYHADGYNPVCSALLREKREMWPVPEDYAGAALADTPLFFKHQENPVKVKEALREFHRALRQLLRDLCPPNTNPTEDRSSSISIEVRMGNTGGVPSAVLVSRPTAAKATRAAGNASPPSQNKSK